MRRRPPGGIGDGTDEVRVVKPGEKTESAIERARRILEAKRACEPSATIAAERERIADADTND
jgi:hypothetical protein